MTIPKQQKIYMWLLALACVVGMCAGCAQEVNYYPNVSKPSRYSKNLTKREKQCAGEFYANRHKRYGNGRR